MKYCKLSGVLLGFCILTPFVHAGELVGTLYWSQRLDMGTLVSGVISTIAVKPGQSVSKGDLLLSLDGRGFRAEVASARASVKLSEILLQEAVREDERADELYERTVLSEHERVQTRIALHEAQASEARAKADLINARLNLERSQLRAPFDGVVLSLSAMPGQTIQSNLESRTLIVLANTRLMRFAANVGTQTLHDLRQADQVFIEFAGQRIEGGNVQVALEPVGGVKPSALYPVQVEFTLPEEAQVRLGDSARLIW